MVEKAARPVEKCFHGVYKDRYCVFCETLKGLSSGTLKPPPLRKGIIKRVCTIVMDTIAPWRWARIDNTDEEAIMKSALQTWAEQEGSDDVLVS